MKKFDKYKRKTGWHVVMREEKGVELEVYSEDVLWATCIMLPGETFEEAAKRVIFDFIRAEDEYYDFLDRENYLEEHGC